MARSWLSFTHRLATTHRSPTPETRFILSPGARASSLMGRSATRWKLVHSCLFLRVTSIGSRIFLPILLCGLLFMDLMEENRMANKRMQATGVPPAPDARRTRIAMMRFRLALTMRMIGPGRESGETRRTRALHRTCSFMKCDFPDSSRRLPHSATSGSKGFCPSSEYGRPQIVRRRFLSSCSNPQSLIP
jgi:hypothetical protein